MKRFLKKFISAAVASVITFIAVLPCFAEETAELPDITAESAVVLHLESGEILYSKEPRKRVSVAFLSKIMTVILAFEKIENLDTLITVSDTAFNGVPYRGNDKLKIGEQLKAIDLIYCIMVATSNDACNVLAEYIGGTKESFVEMMNARAAELGAVDTLFTNSHGIVADGEDPESAGVQHTTAADAAKITAFAFSLERFSDMSEGASKNQDVISFADISDCIYHVIDKTNKQTRRELYSNNRFRLDDKYRSNSVTGIKTSSNDFGLSIAAVKSGNINGAGKQKLLCVTMFSENGRTTDKLYEDTNAAWNYCFENIRYATLLSEGQIVKTIGVELGATADKLNIISKNDVCGFITGEYSKDKLEYVGDLPVSVTAPVSKGDDICTLEVFYDGVSFGTAEFVAAVNVERDELGYLLSQISDFFSSWIVKVAIIIVLIGIGIYIFIVIDANKKRRRNKTKKVGSRFRF